MPLGKGVDMYFKGLSSGQEAKPGVLAKSAACLLAFPGSPVVIVKNDPRDKNLQTSLQAIVSTLSYPSTMGGVQPRRVHVLQSLTSTHHRKTIRRFSSPPPPRGCRAKPAYNSVIT